MLYSGWYGDLLYSANYLEFGLNLYLQTPNYNWLIKVSGFGLNNKITVKLKEVCFSLIKEKSKVLPSDD